MKILAIGGMSSGVGKTELICRILSLLPGWGVLKTSVRSGRKERPGRTDGAWELITSPAELLVEQKDTERYHRAGAASIAWLRSGQDALGEGMAAALPLFESLPGVVVEGNSHTFHRKPDRLILVARTVLEEIKPTARRLLPSADLVVLNTGPDPLETRRTGLRNLQAAGAKGEILVGDVTSPGFLRKVEARLFTWFPR